MKCSGFCGDVNHALVAPFRNRFRHVQTTKSRETQTRDRLVVLLASPPAFGLWIRALFERSAIRMPNCFVCKTRCPGNKVREREELPGFNGQNPSRYCHDMCWESVKDVSSSPQTTEARPIPPTRPRATTCP